MSPVKTGVSVPLRGSLFQSPIDSKNKPLCVTVVFPSPYGVVCFNPGTPEERKHLASKMFPSPYGVVCFNPTR